MKQSEEKLWSVGAHVGSIFLGPLCALVVFFVFKDRSRYIGHHAHQAMWFFSTAWLAAFVLRFLGPLSILSYVIVVAAFVMGLVAGLSALGGHYYEYPIIGRIWRRALGN